MKAKHIASILSLLLTSAVLPLAASATPRDTARHSHPAVTLQPPSQYPTANQSQSEAKTFTGKITKSGSRYVLEDQTMNSTYYLDDAESAAKYEGKNVKVTGTLDAANRTIHVEKIEAA